MRSKLFFTNRARLTTGHHFLTVLCAALLLALFDRRADACPRRGTSLPAPVVEDAGLEPRHMDERSPSGGHLWVRLAPNDPMLPSTYVLEPVGGRPPRGLAHWWGRPLIADSDELVVPIRSPIAPFELATNRPLLFGFQVRGVDTDGRAGAPSQPIWLSFDPAQPAPVRAVGAEAPRSDQVLFFLLAIGLGTLWYWYRRETWSENKIRLAALGALGSVVFLSVTAAMPWLRVVAGAAGHGGSVECLLGQEAFCVHQAGASMRLAFGADEISMAHAAFEVQRWECASAALRMGQVTALALLLPALVWLLVDPRHRAAQAAAAVGASVAGFTLLVVLLYRQSVPSWLGAELSWTADIAIMTTSNIVVAAVLIVRQSFALLNFDPLPQAVARYRRWR